MGDVKIRLSAEDHASKTIQHVQKQLGIFNKEGLAMGISFAVVNKAIDLAQRGFQLLSNEIMSGIQRSVEFQLNIVRIINTVKEMDVSVKELRADLKEMSMGYGVDVNVLATELKNFTREGYSASESLRLVSEAEAFAKANGIDLHSTIGAMNTAMEVFNLDADDSGYILKKLNDIYNSTGMSIEDIDNALGRSALNIHKSGLSLNDIVNILYTLKELGTKPKSMTSGLTDYLETMSGLDIKILPEDQVKSIDEELSNVEETTSSHWDTMVQGVKDKFATAGEYIGWWFTTFLPAMTGHLPTPEPKKEPVFKEDLFGDLKREADELNTKLNSTNDEIKTHSTNIMKWSTQINKLTTIHTLNNDLRYMSYGLQDASYATKIQNESTRELVNSLRIQQQEVDELNRINSQYSISSRTNDIEIMKIQYAAMGRRHGITRAEERRIHALERLNLGYQISVSENQNKIDEINLNMEPLQKKYQLTQMWYNNELATITDTYTDEVTALNVKIGLEQDALREHQAKLAEINAAILQNDMDTYNARIQIQQGNFIPANDLIMNTTNRNNITVNNTNVINNPLDILTLVRTMGKATAMGLIDSNGRTISQPR